MMLFKQRTYPRNYRVFTVALILTMRTTMIIQILLSLTLVISTLVLGHEIVITRQKSLSN
jgi:hypothetical protein